MVLWRRVGASLFAADGLVPQGGTVVSTGTGQLRRSPNLASDEPLLNMRKRQTQHFPPPITLRTIPSLHPPVRSTHLRLRQPFFSLTTRGIYLMPGMCPKRSSPLAHIFPTVMILSQLPPPQLVVARHDFPQFVFSRPYAPDLDPASVYQKSLFSREKSNCLFPTVLAVSF